MSFFHIIFLFKVQFVAQILQYSAVFEFRLNKRWHDKLQQGGREGVPVQSDWFKRVSSKTWHHVDGPGVELDGSDVVLRSKGKKIALSSLSHERWPGI